MIRFSSPAKIHLLGEHSVSYGKPALLTGINLRLTLNLKPSKKRERNIKEIASAQTAIENTIKKRFNIKNIPPYSVEINSNFPIGSGLGSSSAISATLTAALLKHLKIKADKETIYEIAMNGENVFHGKSSGGDLAASTYGGLLWFRRETEVIKVIKPLTFSKNLQAKQFFLINTGRPQESTRQMVEKLAKLKKKRPREIELLLNSQESLTKQLATAIASNDEKLFENAILLGEKNLEKLGVVSNKTKKLIRQIEKLGGVAKILGAGGAKDGSGMILIYHKQPNKLKGFDLIKIKIAQEGLKNEK